MSEELYKCYACNKSFTEEEICVPNGTYLYSNMCKWCSNERHFRYIAVNYILNTYNLRFGEYSDELLEIEIIRAKTRWVLRGGETNFITYKKENMVTQVNNSNDLRQALNENLDALLTKKRKLLVAKEVNNTLGKFLIDVKMEIMQNVMSGNKEVISWFDNNKQKELAEEIGQQYGVTPRIKYGS